MGIVPYHEGELEPTQPLTAQGILATVVDAAKMQGVTMPPSWKEIVGRHAKALIEEGVPQDVVIAACYMATVRGKPQVAQYIAGDLQLAGAGIRMSDREYEQKLALYAADQRGSLLADTKARLAAREADIERRRNGRQS